MDPERLFSSGMNPSWGIRHKIGCQTAEKLYRNAEGFQVGKELGGILMLNHVHAEPAGVLQVQGAVVNEHAFFSGPLGDFQSDAEYGFFRFARVQVTGAEKSGEVFSQVKCLDAVIVKFQGFVVNGGYEILVSARGCRKDSASLGILPGLRKHEGGELFAREGARAVKEGAIEILVQSDLPRIKRRKGKIVAILKILPVQLKGLRGCPPGLAIPTIGKDDAADVPEQRGDSRQVQPPGEAIEKYQKCLRDGREKDESRAFAPRGTCHNSGSRISPEPACNERMRRRRMKLGRRNAWPTITATRRPHPANR